MINLAQKISLNMYSKEEFSFKDVYIALPNEKKESIRARVYENLNKYFEKIGRGIYKVIRNDNECLIIEGDGRDLSMIEDETIDCIITDHPWLNPKSNKGGNRNFTNTYDCFKYELKDFMEKARVLKKGSFLVEVLPEENESNYEYLYQIKQMAKQAGFLYYAKVPWKKGTFVSNTGRKSGNVEDILFFSKGKARSLRYDAKKSKKENVDSYMSGTNKMLCTTLNTSNDKTNQESQLMDNQIDLLNLSELDYQAVSKSKKIHQSEKPVELILAILDYITKENEWVLDQFSGSGVVGEASLLSNRNCVLIELLKDNIKKIAQRLGLVSDFVQVLE